MRRYYHGGQAGLHVGDMLLPPTESGATAALDCLTDASTEMREKAAKIPWRDRVYLTSDQAEAHMFAALHPSGTAARGGDVYRAEPIGDTEPDPDYTGPADVVMCARARIVGICRTGVSRGRYMSLLDAL